MLKWLTSLVTPLVAKTYPIMFEKCVEECIAQQLKTLKGVMAQAKEDNLLVVVSLEMDSLPPSINVKGYSKEHTSFELIKDGDDYEQ